jgi:ribonucleoside-diphosphate reductase alpha chain
MFFVYENKSGNLTIVNEWFVNECKDLDIWNPSFVDLLKTVDGDVNMMNGEVPDELKDRYRTAFDHDQYKLVDCAAARQKWMDMGQSLNLFNNTNSLKFLNDLYFHARRRGLKSTYYLRNKSASRIEKSTGSPMLEIEGKHEANACSIEAMARGEECESCQ